MAVFSSGYCKITGLSKAMPEAHYIPMMPALSQNEQSQLYGCKITMAAHMDHHYVPIIEFGKGKGPGVISCKITGRVAESVARPVPLPEEGVEVKRVHRFKKDLRYMEPFVSRLANQAEKAAMEELLEKMRNTSELDQAHYFVYALNDRRTGKTGMVLSYEYEEAIRTGAIESILLSGDSNSLVVRIKDGPMCTIPMDKVGKMQVERLSEEEMIFDGRGPDREIIEQQRREKAAREKEDREQMAEYLAEMERKRKERELRKKEKMKDTMKRKMAEAEEAERRQKAMDEEIRKQYEEAARIREEAEAAKAAAREAMLARREKKDAEARAKRAEELAEKARLAEEQLQREEAERLAAEEARLAQEAAAANALAAVDPHDMSVNELLEHMRQNTDDEALLRDMQEAANTGMSSQQIADMVVTSTIEAIEEEFADPDEDEEEVEEEEEDDEDKEDEDQLDALPEGLSEEERKAQEEALRQLREEQLEMRRKEREAKRLARQRKREEQERKEEAKRQAKEARERKKREMMERMAAIYKADAEDEAERMKKPEKREIKPRELLRRKRPADIEIPPPEGPAEFLVRTSDGKAVLTEDELDEMSVVEGRISSDATGRLTPGRAVKTNSGIEFIAGRIITTEEGEVFEPGQDVELLAGPKFVPGQTVATPHGPQFVAGKTIGEGENIEFVPGHVVALGEDKGDIFVPGQVMETDEGPKFVPGSVYRCRRAGPLFVPGQLRDGEFVPGKIVETEDGPRFLSPKFPGHEEQFTYVVQSFDLDPAELDLVKFQYHTPEPSPVFQGQDIGESINLMQLAARGYQAKTIRVPEPRPPPPKSKRQIYENVRVTFLDCIDSAERARDEEASHILGRDALTVEARRLQRVLADDLDNPLPMTEVSAFLKKCLSLVTPTRDVGIWIDGFFGHNEQGIFRPMQRMRERKLSQKVSLQKTLADIVQEMETELEEAQKRDIVMHSLAKVMKRQPPLRTHVDDYRERWQEVISGILLTSGKVVLNDAFDTTAYRDEHCVKTVLDDIREKVGGVTGDPQSVDILEDSICRYIEEKSTGKVEELLCINKDDHVPDGDGQTQRLFLTEAANLALLENETAVAQCLRQCLETPGLVCLLPFLHDAMELLRTVTHLRTLSEGDERRQALLGDLSKNPGLLCDNQLWLKLVSGAILVTKHAASPARRLRSARCVPDEAVALVAEFHSSEIDTVFRQVVLAASREVHGLPYDQTDLPVMVVKNQFEGILPRHLARNVIDGRLQYLLVNEDGVKLVRPGMDDEKNKEMIERQTAVEPNNEAPEEKNDSTELDPCKDKCTCYPDETVSEPREASTANVPADAPATSTPRKTSSASQKKEGAVEGVETCEDSPPTTGGGEEQKPVHEVSAPSPHGTPTHVVEQEAGEPNSEECVREAENLETCKDSLTMHGSAADENKETGSGESDLTPDSLSTHVVQQEESTPCAADDVQAIGQSEACKDAASFPESAPATDEKAPGCETSKPTPESSSTHVVKQGDTNLSAGGDAQVTGQSEEGEDSAGMAECETGAKEETPAHETGPTPDNLLNQDEDRESSKPSPEDDARDAKDISKEHGSPNPEEQDPENVAAASEEQLDGDKQMDSEMKTDQTEVKEEATKDSLA